MPDAVVEVRELSFRYRPEQPEVLRGVRLEIERGARCLLLGANGAGKTTLLRIVAGKHMVSSDSVRVLGSSAFHDTSLAGRVEFLGGSFPFEVDIQVATLVRGVRGVDEARRDRLVDLLGVDLGWHMHSVSDGQRRRVQILLGLMRPSEVLLLDEVTTDLDLVARQDLLSFLREECETRGAAILYATHILGGLDDWATHLAYMSGGQVLLMKRLEEIPELVRLRESGSPSPLLRLLDGWLRRDSGR